MREKQVYMYIRIIYYTNKIINTLNFQRILYSTIKIENDNETSAKLYNLFLVRSYFLIQYTKLANHKWLLNIHIYVQESKYYCIYITVYSVQFLWTFFIFFFILLFNIFSFFFLFLFSFLFFFFFFIFFYFFYIFVYICIFWHASLDKGAGYIYMMYVFHIMNFLTVISEYKNDCYFMYGNITTKLIHKWILSDFDTLNDYSINSYFESKLQLASHVCN